MFLICAGRGKLPTTPAAKGIFTYEGDIASFNYHLFFSKKLNAS
tara:strand:+ start:175 stop:306 length:132 start_codon:yes stop_codon:yes gene_type:complete